MENPEGLFYKCNAVYKCKFNVSLTFPMWSCPEAAKANFTNIWPLMKNKYYRASKKRKPEVNNNVSAHLGRKVTAKNSVSKHFRS